VGASTITHLAQDPTCRRRGTRCEIPRDLARRLEAELHKARILEIYLNVIEWGDGIYGADAAAHSYFSTSAASLGPQQAALLAAAIINPRALNPAHPTSRLLQRQQLILRRMGG
jgi:monofunctional biosynthetic peptidoglycan transglycosylase